MALNTAPTDGIMAGVAWSTTADELLVLATSYDGSTSLAKSGIETVASGTTLDFTPNDAGDPAAARLALAVAMKAFVKKKKN
jgi:hypothetical protein